MYITFIKNLIESYKTEHITFIYFRGFYLKIGRKYEGQCNWSELIILKGSIF